MSLMNTPDRFGSMSKTLHWIISPLVILMLVAGYFMGDLSNPLKGTVINLHKLIGVLILVLMLIRLVWALCNPKPQSPPGTSVLEHVAEWTVHFALYALIIAQPVVGWIGSVAGGRPPHLGGFLLYLPVEQSKTLSKACFQIHNTLAVVIIVVVSLHVLAALYHHFILKDNVLKRMMPRG